MVSGTTSVLAEEAAPRTTGTAACPRVAYVAYPSSLVLRSANSVQTYATARALRAIAPDCRILVPRFGFRESTFASVGATHLMRIPFNVGRHLVRTTLWSYAERAWFSFRVLAWLARQRLRGTAPEVMYVRDVVCAALLSLLAARVGGAAVVYEVHEREAENRSANTGPVARWLARHMDRVALGRAAGVVSLTRAFLPEIAGYRSEVPAASVAVIPDAYDDETFKPTDRAAARIALGIGDEAFVVAYTGLTFAYHGVDLLVSAFATLAHDAPAAQLVLIGGRDREREEMRRLAAGYNIDERVTIVPPKPAIDVVTYMAAADVLVIPDTVTRASASPLKLFEYAAMDRPIVAADLAALREVLSADAARYVPPQNAAALAAGIQWVAEHSDEAGIMAGRARESVAAHTYAARAAAIADFCQQFAQV